MKIHYRGLLQSPASWARVGRELIKAMLDLGAEITAEEAKGYLFDPKFPLDQNIKNVITKNQKSDVEIGFIYPLQYSKMKAPIKVGLLTYESTIIPPAWVESIKKGDILVSPMTQPNFVSILSKAKGIITDEGGITCHAAIVARELKKPCIIGTGNATEILKDGDLVEVDAERGVVKIIKKNG